MKLRNLGTGNVATNLASEARALMNIRLGYELKMGAGIGFALARSR